MQMNIFYNYDENEWQSDHKQSLDFGKNLLPIKIGKSSTSSCFFVKKQNKKVGPLIGILTSKEGRNDFYGNRSTFKKIQNYLLKHGGISFVMTPEGYDGKEKIQGFLYDQGKWRKATFPLPDVIYNRVASYKAEQYLGVIKKMAFNNAIPFYNPHFFEKWETFKQLSNNKFLLSYLPKTELLESVNQLQNWLLEYNSFIVKPVLSNRGNGIYLINKFESHYEVKTNSSSKCFDSIEAVWEDINKNSKTIIQQKIQLKQYNNRPYDLRILVQRQKDTWEISGIGVRCAGLGAITTHVPQGGEILSLESVNDGLNLDEIELLASEVAHQLELAYGYLCEFSIDLGVDENNSFWIFEINSKPMKFDEPHIQKKALETLIQCFYDDAGFI